MFIPIGFFENHDLQNFLREASAISSRLDLHIFCGRENHSYTVLNPISANLTKWSNNFKQFIGKTDELFDHFVRMALKGLKGPWH